jgi:hypothetical protein
MNLSTKAAERDELRSKASKTCSTKEKENEAGAIEARGRSGAKQARYRR